MHTSSSPLKQELEQLLHQEISPEQFYHSYLGLLMRTLQGMAGCHLWLAQGSEFVPFGGSDRGPILFDSNPAQQQFILQTIERCATQQTTVFSPWSSNTANKCQYGLAFTPLLFGKGGGAVQGVQVSWWRTRDSESLAEQLTALLDDCGRTAARVARNQKLESMARLSESLQLMEHYMGEISTAPDLKTLAVTIVNRTRELVGCDRCALVAIKVPGKLSVEAISNVPTLASKSAVARTIVQLAENAKETGLPAGFRKAAEKLKEQGDLSDYFYHNQMEEVLVVGIQAPKQALLGMLVLESEKIGFFDAQRHQTAVSVANNACGPLRRTLDYEFVPFRGLGEKLARWRRRSAEERKRWLRSYLWIPGAILTLLLLFPAKFQFSGDVRLMPTRRALAVAQTPGRILELLVTDGAAVEKGQPLARIDDAEQRKQLEIASQEEARLAAETDRLTSSNERVAARVASLTLQKAKSEREYWEDQLSKTIIRSPIQGVVMTPNLASRQGEMLPFGGQLALVGNPADWEVAISVPESDIAEIIGHLQKGRTIPVRYLLNSLPHRSFNTLITNPLAVAATSEVVSGKNVFRVVAPVKGEVDLLRAGYTGRARLEMGRKPLAITATRRFFNWLRTHVFF